MSSRDDNREAQKVLGEDAALCCGTWRLDLAYEGTAYHGWARQPGQRTVEGMLGDALETVLRDPVRLSVAGRTDSGVHAWAQVASFVCARGDLHPERLRLSLNALLPPDIAVSRVSRAPSGFTARKAVSRTYQYRLSISPVKPVRDRAYVWNVRGAVDVELLAEAAALLPGSRDFAAFTPSAHLYHSCVRRVLRASWAPAAVDGPPGSPRLEAAPQVMEWVFTISAGSFLHNMVRVAVGSIVDVAQGRMTVAEFADGLAAGERQLMGQTAPARGLALVAVAY
jgi:tRNA pseudouridine38-40 synthase